MRPRGHGVVTSIHKQPPIARGEVIHMAELLSEAI